MAGPKNAALTHHNIIIYYTNAEADQTGFNPELEEFKLEEESEREERNVSADGSLSDTSDPEQANEIDELLSPGFPVYFNFAIQNTSHSLKVSIGYVPMDAWLLWSLRNCNHACSRGQFKTINPNRTLETATV